MVKITSINKIILSVFLLVLPTHSMEKKPFRPVFSRSNSERDLFAGSSPTSCMKETLSKPDSELFVKPLPITCANVTFPAETKELEEAIKNHTARIEIYIPRACKYLCEQTKVCSLDYDSTGVLNIKQLRIKHSIGNDRGYWKSALEALIPFIGSAQNLQQITLSHGIVEELLPIIAKKIRIIVDCSCVYSSTDTIYSQTSLENIRDVQEVALKKKYPDRSIVVLKAANSKGFFCSDKFKS